MKLSPYLTFNGQCETAFKFYEHCLGGKITAMMTFGEAIISLADKLSKNGLVFNVSQSSLDGVERDDLLVGEDIFDR